MNIVSPNASYIRVLCYLDVGTTSIQIISVSAIFHVHYIYFFFAISPLTLNLACYRSSIMINSFATLTGIPSVFLKMFTLGRWDSSMDNRLL